MMKLLLDEHVSPRVATGLRAKNRELMVEAIAEWRNGILLGQEDKVILQEAALYGFTLVTYDQKTTRPIVCKWVEQERHHAGVIFVDERTIFPGNIGELIRSLADFLATHGELDWRDRVMFLDRTVR